MHLVNYINAISSIDDSEELKTLSESISSVLVKANSNIHARINRGKKDGETSEE